jgi:DNA-binding Lrp family transcriptional regulator
MPKAYILINCKSGNETHVADSINSIENVLTCSVVYGVYDIIVEILFDKISDLEALIQKRIRKISNIQSTMTLIPFDFN